MSLCRTRTEFDDRKNTEYPAYPDAHSLSFGGTVMFEEKSMKLVENVDFPSEYLDCYEAVLIVLLKYMGLSNESSIMGTQAFFYLADGPNGIKIEPRFNSVDSEWERVFGILFKRLIIANETDLRDGILSKLNVHLPICLPTDLFYLHYTPHYHRLHQTHFLSIFGYDDNGYYVICPYYRYAGWIDTISIHKSFFSLVGGHRHFFYMPKLELRQLTVERVQSLMQESCQNMLGLTIPNELAGVDPKYLGLSGITTLSSYLKRFLDTQSIIVQNVQLLDLSRQTISIGNSRYWFSKFMEQHEEGIFSNKLAKETQKQFMDLGQLWRGIGRLLGTGAHTQNVEKLKSVITYLDSLHRQEAHLFSHLLSVVSEYEEGLL